MPVLPLRRSHFIKGVACCSNCQTSSMNARMSATLSWEWTPSTTTMSMSLSTSTIDGAEAHPMLSVSVNAPMVVPNQMPNVTAKANVGGDCQQAHVHSRGGC